MASHFADRLTTAIRKKGVPACVGLDPLVERLPAALLAEIGIRLTSDGAVDTDAPPERLAAALLEFGAKVIRAVASEVPAIKINIAFFERYGADGVRVYFDLVRQAHEAGLIVIGDVKRADIGHSSTQYAEAHLGDHGSAGPITPDAVTVNPYFGFDAIRPFLGIAAKRGRGIFVLVQTSNESAGEVQGLTLSDGLTVCQRIGQLVQDWATGEGLVGKCGYSCVGAVVSPRDLASTERIRTLMPNCLFLVPGFGAQGRTSDEVAKCFKPDGTGALVTASRSVIYAYQDARYQQALGDDWTQCVARGCKDFVKAIRAVCPH